MSIDQYLQETEEEIAERARILGESDKPLQSKKSRDMVMKLIKDCDVTTTEAQKTRNDLADMLQQMEENQRILLEKAISKIEQEYSGGRQRRLEVITELESPTTVNMGGTKLVVGQKIVICNCGNGRAHIKSDSCED